MATSGRRSPDDDVSNAQRRFLRYSSLSLVTVPAGYSLLLLAHSVWDINAGLLNLLVGLTLTIPSFVLYRRFVWRDRGGRFCAELFSFWQTVMLSALAPSAAIAIADAWFESGGLILVLAGISTQGVVFLARYFWLDRVTFSAGE